VRYESLQEDLKKLQCTDIQSNTIQNEIKMAGISAIVFGGMSLEATLYDLSACLFEEPFAEHIDKLDPIGKFFVLNRIINGTNPDVGSVTYQSIQRLASARNKLVHHKSFSFVELDFDSIMRRALKEHTKQVDSVPDSFRALVLLSLNFDGNIFEELRILPSFRKKENWKDAIPISLHSEVNRCIEISNNESSRATVKTESDL